MDSKIIKQAFANNGIKVRVKAFNNGSLFRVCRLNDEPHNKEQSSKIAAELGLLDVYGNLGGNFNQAWEMMVRYKPE